MSQDGMNAVPTAIAFPQTHCNSSLSPFRSFKQAVVKKPGNETPRCWAGMKKGCRAGWFRRGTRKVAVTYSPAFAVPSARRGLTSLFGMGRGGAPVLWPPECLCAHAPDRGRAYGVKRSGRKQDPDGTDTRGRHGGRRPRLFLFLGTAPRKGSGY